MKPMIKKITPRFICGKSITKEDNKEVLEIAEQFITTLKKYFENKMEKN